MAVSEWVSEVTQLCPTLCNPMGCTLPDSSIHGNFQARILEWVGTSFSRGSSRPRDRTQVSRIATRLFTIWKWKWSRVRLFATPWTVAYQTALSVGFSRQEYWSGLPFPPPVDLPNPGIEPGSPALQTDALPSEPPGNGRTEIKSEATGGTADPTVQYRRYSRSHRLRLKIICATIKAWCSQINKNYKK